MQDWKSYYKTNKERILQNALNYRASSAQQPRKLYRSARQNAKRKGIEFSIEVEDILIPEICPLLLVPLTNIQGKGRQDTNASVDRIDSSRGYVPGNVWVISDLANRMKNSATNEQLVTFARSILATLLGPTPIFP